jgi:hypothetical protein
VCLSSIYVTTFLSTSNQLKSPETIKIKSENFLPQLFAWLHSSRQPAPTTATTTTTTTEQRKLEMRRISKNLMQHCVMKNAFRIITASKRGGKNGGRLTVVSEEEPNPNEYLFDHKNPRMGWKSGGNKRKITQKNKNPITHNSSRINIHLSRSLADAAMVSHPKEELIYSRACDDTQPAKGMFLWHIWALYYRSFSVWLIDVWGWAFLNVRMEWSCLYVCV